MKRLAQKPLPSAFLLIGLLLVLVSAIYTFSGTLSKTWGVLWILCGIIMVAASLKSLELYAEI